MGYVRRSHSWIATDRLPRWLPRRPLPLPIRYGFPAALVAASFLLLASLHTHTEDYWFFVFYPAIMTSSAVFDRGSGYVATALSGAAAYLYVMPEASWLLPSGLTLPFVLFVVLGFVIAWMGEALRAALEQAVASERARKLLMEELEHRTRNDLALITSMLRLQARSEPNGEVRAALEATEARISAIGDAHAHLAAGEPNRPVQISEYLETLCEHLRQQSRGARDVTIEVTGDNVSVIAREAAMLGLIVNELVTNALKYAFQGRNGGTVRVVYRSGPPRTLMVEDDGTGCGPGNKDGTGSKLLRMLARQLGGRIRRQDRRPGCRVCVTFYSPQRATFE